MKSGFIKKEGRAFVIPLQKANYIPMKNSCLRENDKTVKFAFYYYNAMR